FLALSLGRIHRRGSAAHIDKSQPTGIAMRQQVHALPDEFCAVATNGFAVLHVFIGKFFGPSARQGLLLFNCFSRGHRGENLVHGIDGIDSSRPGRFESVIDKLKMTSEFWQVASPKSAGALRQAVSCRRANSSRATDDHVMNCLRGLTKVCS